MLTCLKASRKSVYPRWINDIFQTFWHRTNDQRLTMMFTVFLAQKNPTLASLRLKSVAEIVATSEVGKAAPQLWRTSTKWHTWTITRCPSNRWIQALDLLQLSMGKTWCTRHLRLLEQMIQACRGLWSQIFSFLGCQGIGQLSTTMQLLSFPLLPVKFMMVEFQKVSSMEQANLSCQMERSTKVLSKMT